MYFHFKKAVRGVLAGWWHVRKNRHLKEKYSAERLAELTREWKSRFP